MILTIMGAESFNSTEVAEPELTPEKVLTESQDQVPNKEKVRNLEQEEAAFKRVQAVYAAATMKAMEDEPEALDDLVAWVDKLKAKFPEIKPINNDPAPLNYQDYQLYHGLVGSTPKDFSGLSDIEGEWSVLSFADRLAQKYKLELEE